MFTIRVSITCSPEHRAVAVEKLMNETSEVPNSFSGCERFAVAIDVHDTNTIHIIEEWTDADSFRGYQQSEYFGEAMSIIGPCIVAPPDSAYYESTLVGP